MSLQVEKLEKNMAKLSKYQLNSLIRQSRQPMTKIKTDLTSQASVKERLRRP